MNRTVATVALVLLSLVLGSLWLRSHDASVRATAALRAKDVELDSLRRVAEDYEGVRQIDRRRTQLMVAALRERILEDSTLADSLRIAGHVRAVELRGALPSDLRPALDSLVLTHVMTVERKDSIIAYLNLHNALLQGELARADSSVANYQQALSLAMTQRDGWKKEASRR